jgi:hypothetical protein
VLRSTRISGHSSGIPLATSAAVSVTQYAPYVGRAMINIGRGSYPAGFDIRFGSSAGLADYFDGTNVTTAGMLSQVFVPSTSSMFFSLGELTASGLTAGDYIDIPYVSVSRCTLVDNGQNLLLQSDEFDTTWTATRASVDDQATAAPDGTTTADSIIEDATAANTHQVSQAVTVSSAAGDYALSVALKAGARTWAHIALSHATGAATAWVNLSTGAIGTVSNGTDWSSARGFVSAMGNGWYVLTLVARKTSSATSVTAIIRPTTADNTQSYSGDGTSNIYAWRATLAQASVPTRLVQTTTTATTGTSQTGSAVHLRGLPASTNGLLLPDDRVEIITDLGSEMKIVTASLNSDAAGRGYLQFEPPLRGTPAEGAAVIVNQPMTRAMFAGDMVGWDDSPGIITAASAEFEEAA